MTAPRPHRRLAAVASALTLAAGLLPGPALAGAPGDDPTGATAPQPPRRVALLDLVIEGGTVPDHLRQRLGDALRTEIGRARADVVGGDGLGDAAGGCTRAGCAGETAQHVEARYAVLPRLTVDGPDYTFSTTIIGANGEVAATLEDTCEVCGADELEGTITEVAIRARKQLDAYDTAPPMFNVTSTPPGAVVTLDGEPIGETPLAVQVPSGEHDIVVALDGHIKRRERLGFVDGVEERLSVKLEPLPDEVTGDGRRIGRGLRIGGFTALGLGVAGVGAGVGMFMADNREITSDCSGDNVDADGDCRFAWDTTPGAVALTVTGGALMITGAVLVAVGYKKRKDALASRPHVEPRLGGMALRF